MHSDRALLFLNVAALGGVVFLHFPLLIIAIYAFNTESAAFSFSPQGFTLRGFHVATMALIPGTLTATTLWRSAVFWPERHLAVAAVADCLTRDDKTVVGNGK